MKAKAKAEAKHIVCPSGANEATPISAILESQPPHLPQY
jgi:hypothetical protein